MCTHTTTTFTCGHEYTHNTRCTPRRPTIHRAHESQIMLQETPVLCADCALGRPRGERQDEVSPWVEFGVDSTTAAGGGLEEEVVGEREYGIVVVKMGGAWSAGGEENRRAFMRLLG